MRKEVRWTTDGSPDRKPSIGVWQIMELPVCPSRIKGLVDDNSALSSTSAAPHGDTEKLKFIADGKHVLHRQHPFSPWRPNCLSERPFDKDVPFMHEASRLTGENCSRSVGAPGTDRKGECQAAG